MKARHTFVATGLVALLALAGVTAAIAADPAGDPPPRIAFLANGIVPADALAAGPVAGQLGAPVFTTQPDDLSTPAAEGLDDYNPELVIVLGGPVAITDGVVNQVSSVTGLAIQSATPPPSSGIVRAAGPDRFATAKVVADLLAAYDPAYLGVDLQAIDADLLDGLDSSAFLGADDKAADSDLLDGLDSGAFMEQADFDGLVPIAVFTFYNGSIVSSSHRAPLTGAPTIASNPTTGRYDIDLPGYSFSITSDSYSCTAAAASALTIVVDSTSDFITRSFNSAGTPTDPSFFSCSVYKRNLDGGSSGASGATSLGEGDTAATSLR